MLGWENLALAIKDKFEGFSKKKKKQGEVRVWKEERKGEKKRVCRKSRKIP